MPRFVTPLALLAALVAAAPASAQWEYVGPGIFTPVDVAQHDGQVFFAVTRGTGATISGGIIYRSPDGLSGWEPVPDPLVTAARPLGPYITALGAGGGAVAFATREAYNVAYVYVSDDDGASWTERTTVPTVYEGGIRALAVLDADTIVGIANTGGGQARMFVTTDGGATWTVRDRAFSSAYIPTLLAVDGSLVMPYVSQVAGQNVIGVEVSDDLGVTWTARTHTSTQMPAVGPILWADGRRLFQYVPRLSTAEGPRLHWSDDLGATWTSADTAPEAVAGTVASMASRGDRLVARGFLRQRPPSAEVIDDEVVGVSPDLGATWAAGDRDSTVLRGTELPGGVYADPVGVVGVPGGFVYAPVLKNTNASALYVSADGMDWTAASVNGFGQGLGSVFEHGGELYAFEIGAGSAGGYWRSTDGAAWRYIGHLNDRPPNLSGTCGESGYPGLAASVDSVVVAVCTNAGQAFRSRDGATFAAVGDLPDTRLRMLAEDGGRLFAAGFNSTLGSTGGQSGTLYRSDDAGATWTTLATDLRTLTRPSVAGDAVIMAEAGTVYLSTDGGATFAEALAIPGTFASDQVGAAATPTALFAGAAQTNGFFNAPEFYRSLDGGATWQNLIADGLLTDAPRSLHALRDGSVVAVFTDSVAVSSDDGATWRSLAEGWPAGTRGEDALVFRDTLYVQTYTASLWRAALSDFVATDGGPTAAAPSPEAALALTAAPNPASGAATVRYRLGAPARVTLTVHDVLGRTVATLTEAEAPAGEHTVRLDAAALAPGAYVVRLATADGRRAARTLTVAR